jgi:hypothetical protein
MNKQQILDRLTEARASLLAAIEGLSGEEMTALPVADTWTLREILAHIGGWAAWDLAAIKQVQAGRHPNFDPIQDVDTLNAGLVAVRSGWSLTQILAEMRDAHAALLELLANLSDEELFGGESFQGPYWGNLAEWLQVAWEHEDEHIAQIRAWRERRSI